MNYFLVEGRDGYKIVIGHVVREIKTRELAELFLSAMRLNLGNIKRMRGEENAGKK